MGGGHWANPINQTGRGGDSNPFKADMPSIQQMGYNSGSRRTCHIIEQIYAELFWSYSIQTTQLSRDIKGIRCALKLKGTIRPRSLDPVYVVSYQINTWTYSICSLSNGLSKPSHKKNRRFLNVVGYSI